MTALPLRMLKLPRDRLVALSLLLCSATGPGARFCCARPGSAPALPARGPVPDLWAKASPPPLADPRSRARLRPAEPYVHLPGHLECMEYSLRTCPYLSVPNYLRKVPLDLPSHEGLAVFRSDSDERRPGPSLLVCVGVTGRVSADFAFHVTPTGPCDRMQIWRHGKMVAEGGPDFIARLSALAAEAKAESSGRRGGAARRGALALPLATIRCRLPSPSRPQLGIIVF